MIEQIKKVLVEAINVDEALVTPEAKLNDDLGIDSLAAVELALEVETEFDVRIEDDELAKLETVQDIINIIEVETFEEPRITTPSEELNRVLGGGIVLGSVTLIGGEPGIGKSTLLLQLALKMKKKILYVSGEESASQIKMRADRLTELQNPNCFLFTETSVEKILHEAKN